MYVHRFFVCLFVKVSPRWGGGRGRSGNAFFVVLLGTFPPSPNGCLCLKKGPALGGGEAKHEISEENGEEEEDVEELRGVVSHQLTKLLVSGGGGACLWLNVLGFFLSFVCKLSRERLVSGFSCFVFRRCTKSLPGMFRFGLLLKS